MPELSCLHLPKPSSSARAQTVNSPTILLLISLQIASKGESHYQEARVLMENAQKVIATATEHHDAAKERLRQVNNSFAAA